MPSIGKTNLLLLASYSLASNFLTHLENHTTPLSPWRGVRG